VAAAGAPLVLQLDLGALATRLDRAEVLELGAGDARHLARRELATHTHLGVPGRRLVVARAREGHAEVVVTRRRPVEAEQTRLGAGLHRVDPRPRLGRAVPREQHDLDSGQRPLRDLHLALPHGLLAVGDAAV